MNSLAVLEGAMHMQLCMASNAVNMQYHNIM